MGILYKNVDMIKSYHIIRMLSVFSLFLFVLLSFTTLIPIYNNIDNVEAAAGTATASTLTFTSTRSTASVNLTVDDKDGTFATSTDGTGNTSDQRAVFSIATNNYTGYTLRLKSSTSNTNLSNTTNNTSIPSLVDPTTISTFSSDTSEGKALNNRWGYIPNYYNATGTSPVQNTTTYYPAPTTSGTTLRTTTSRNSANGEDNPDNYTIGLGLRADFTNPTGSYTNDAFILELVANPVAYTITYADNTSDSSVSGIPAAQSGTTTGTGASSTEAESITLSNATPTRTGYTFSGWCLGAVANSGTTCNGTTTPTYTTGGSFGIDKTTGNNITLYATWTINTYNVTVNFAGNGVSSVTFEASGHTTRTVSTSGNTATLDYGTTYTMTMAFTSGYEFDSWALNNANYGTLSSTSSNPATFTPNTSSGSAVITATGKSSCNIYMQNLTAPSIATLLPNTGNTATVCDSRDNQQYTIAKLADGKYWMTTNLNLAGGTALSADNTDVTSTYISGFTTAGGLTKSGSTIVLPATEIISSGTTLSNSSAFSSDTTAYVFNSGNTTCSSSSPCYSYYSWTTATLGGKQSDGSTAVADYNNAAASICPKGWRLPTSTTSNANAQSSTNWKTGDWYALGTAYGADQEDSYYVYSSAFYNAAGPGTTPNFLLAGYYNSSSFGSGGSGGFYWSATSYSSTNAYHMYFTSSDFLSVNFFNRRRGYVVRCVFDINYMQDQTASSLAELMPNTGDTAELVDKRDGEVYTVANLTDGNYWMLDNLRLDLTDSSIRNGLTTSNTHVDSASLTSLLSGNRANGAQYASSGFATWDSSNSSSVYNQAKANADYKNTVASVTYGDGSGKIGVYYNYCAASAGSYCYESSSGTGNAEYDICPHGWRMPTGGSAGEYQALYTAYSGNDSNFQAALSTPLSGLFYGGSARTQGGNGYFWSSTRYSSSSMHSLNVESSEVYPPGTRNRHYGYPVRCVFDYPTMQSVSSSDLGDLMPNNGDTANLIDARDGQEYSVAKINNAYWMTRNLAIGCDGSGSTYGSNVISRSLTSSDSNVNTSWSTPTALLSTAANSSATSGYTTAAMMCDSTYGAWYNYAAATTGTISGSSNETEPTKDICPAGWHLPNYNTSKPAGSVNSIINQTTAFSPVAGGRYYNGSPTYTDYGFWWTTTTRNTTTRYIVDYGESSWATESTDRFRGLYVRCVHDS